MDFGLHVRSAHAPLPLLTGSASKTPTQQPFRCLFCRLSFATELEMQFHLAAHSKQFHCPLCQEAFHVEFLLDKHMQTHHTSQVCHNCTLKFETEFEWEIFYAVKICIFLDAMPSQKYIVKKSKNHDCCNIIHEKYHCDIRKFNSDKIFNYMWGKLTFIWYTDTIPMTTESLHQYLYDCFS